MTGNLQKDGPSSAQFYSFNVEALVLVLITLSLLGAKKSGILFGTGQFD